MICLNRNFHITRYFWLFGPKITSTPNLHSLDDQQLRRYCDQLVNFCSSLDVLFEEKYLYSFWKFILEYKSDWILFCDNYGCFKKPSNQWLAKAGSLQVNKSIWPFRKLFTLFHHFNLTDLKNNLIYWFHGIFKTWFYRFFSLGTCRAGDSCPYGHDRNLSNKGTIPCKFFAVGTCAHGNKCRFSHGDPHIPPLPPAPKDSTTSQHQALHSELKS